jgi:hypothetical protein
MAEWSKAMDLSSITRTCAQVRTLLVVFFSPKLCDIKLAYYVILQQLNQKIYLENLSDYRYNQ